MGSGSRNPFTGKVRLNERHRAIARAWIAGKTPEQLAQEFKISKTYLWKLRKDPRMVEYMEHLSSRVENEFATFHERMGSFSEAIITELRERFEKTPEQFSNSFLKDLMEAFADRTGFGPSSKTTNVNVNVDLAQRLEQARRRVEAGRSLPDGTASGVSSALSLPGDTPTRRGPFGRKAVIEVEYTAADVVPLRKAGGQ